ncbi:MULTISPECIES: hypothetical protein [Sporomusa]|uniref:hypothetical protein n=1 Tax=Sporomusa TaxID=2375 RepID=UPI00166A9010|nr:MULTISPECIES: hypothetical protein [Sporomusa]MCM0757616.1 hypothetical protein [Sporomusa sphaeroides DSM 2875]
MGKKYKTTEKWWLGLIVLFYALYNIPGVPAYGDSNGALWHGVLTILPLWITSYGGMILLTKQRRLKKNPNPDLQMTGAAQEAAAKEEK